MIEEGITFHLHATKTTKVHSDRLPSDGGGWFYTLAIGPVTIFVTPDLLRRISDEAMRAALIADGWTEPGRPTPEDEPTPEKVERPF